MNEEKTTQRPFVFHPFVIGAWFVVDLFAGNFSEVLFPDVVPPLLTVVAGMGVGYFALRLLLRNRHKAGLVLSVGTLLFFTYAAVYDLGVWINSHLQIEVLMSKYGPMRHRYVLPFVGIIFIVAIIYILRTRTNLRSATRFLNVVSAVLMVLALGRLATAEISFRLSSQEEGNVEVITVAPAQTERLKRDIYYIVLDRYASNSTLASAYNFDNSEFLASLEAKGFYLATESRCNYPNSILSLWSSLNMQFLPQRAVVGRICHDFRQKNGRY